MKCLFLLLLSWPAFALEARDLIADAQKLFELTPASAPERRALSLRYADLLFDAALEIHGDAKSTNKDLERAEGYRRRSLALYQNLLPGQKGLSALRIKFQVSRLYAYAGQMDAATKLWRELSRQNEDPHIRRESSLHLAEQLELTNRREALNEAAKLYDSALGQAVKPELRSYILYRSAWTKFRLGEANKATALLRQSLSLASKREHADRLKDLVLFMSREMRPSSEQIKILANYERELGLKGWIDALAEAYFTADRTEDYIATLKYLNKKNPSADRSIALLDAAHDRLTPEQIRAELREIRELKISEHGADKKAAESLFRLAQHWDGQRRAGRSEFVSVLTDGVTTLLTLFPASEETKKSVAGWLAAVPEAKTQIAQLGEWSKSKLAVPAESLVRQHRLEIARREKLWPVVVEESSRLETLASENRRSVRYQKAKALFELGRHDEALPLFQNLAAEKVRDEITVFSQDLALDIWNKKKDYDALIVNAGNWAVGSREKELKPIRDQALFERAVAQKNNESLKQFTAFCMSRRFLPQSCDNAKALAVELREQTVLIGILRMQNDETELARQLEISARFKESARVLEKRPTDFLGRMKIALLYELQGDYPSRDRVLKALAQDRRAGRLKLDDNQESLFLSTLSEAGLLDKSTALKLCADYGGNWRKHQAEAIRELDQRQAKINFVGANSQAKFQSRVKTLEAMAAQADCFMKGLAPEERPFVAKQVSEAYAGFQQKILATPIPQELDEASRAEVQQQIQTMAAPFAERTEAWNKLATAPSEAALKLDSISPLKFDWQAGLEKWQADPFNRESMIELKNHFDQRGLKRLASYMDGRLQGLEQQ